MGDADAAVAADETALGYLGEHDWLLSSHVRWNLGVAEWLRGDLERAERSLAGVFAERRTAGEGYLAMRVAYDLGHVQRARGRLGAALDTYQLGLMTCSEGGRELPAAGMAHVGLAQVLYERGELDAALDHAVRGVSLGRHLAFTQPMATGLATLAWIRQAQGDASGALDAMEEAQGVGVSPDVVALMNPVPALRARLLLARGRSTRLPTGCASGASPSISPAIPGSLSTWCWCVLLAQQEYDRTLGSCGCCSDASNQRRTNIIELQALEALALAAGGDESAALAILSEALGLALPEGYVRVFVDEGTPMAQLVGKSLLPSVAVGSSFPMTSRSMTSSGCGEHSVTEAPGRRPDRTDAADAGVVEPLTGREMQVLGLMAAGMSNQIADELVVVLDTVKKHVGHIFDKLGAANRTQAVARASRGVGAVGLLRACRSGHLDVPSASERLHPKGPLSGEARHPGRL